MRRLFYIFTAKHSIYGKINYEYKNWTDFTWENAVIHSIFGEVR